MIKTLINHLRMNNQWSQLPLKEYDKLKEQGEYSCILYIIDLHPSLISIIDKIEELTR